MDEVVRVEDSEENRDLGRGVKKMVRCHQLSN